MGFSVDDKCKKLAKDPRAAAVVSKYSPGFTTWKRGNARAPLAYRCGLLCNGMAE